MADDSSLPKRAGPDVGEKEKGLLHRDENLIYSGISYSGACPGC